MGKIDDHRYKSSLDQVSIGNSEDRNIKIFIKRDDLLHPVFGGNKLRKLQGYSKMFDQADSRLVTVGGAFSNHLVACAGWAKLRNIKSVGFVKYHEIDVKNPTLISCKRLGMELIPIGRQEVAQAVDNHCQAKDIFIPEGASSEIGTLGFKEVIDEIEAELSPDIIVTSVGLGSTIAGLAQYASSQTEVIGVASFGKEERLRIIKTFSSLQKSNVKLKSFLDWGRFGRYSSDLVSYAKDFQFSCQMQLDPIYTAKTFYYFETQILPDLPENSQVVLYHSGGLQGWKGWDWRYSSITGA